MITPEVLQDAYKEAGEAAYVTPRLTKKQKIVALQRKYSLIHPGENIPDEYESLKLIIPSGLTKKESSSFLYGSLEEAKSTWLRIANTSWTKKSFQQKAKDEGVQEALMAFDPKTRINLKRQIRMLSDG